MKRVGNLFPAVTDFQSLCAAARRAAKGHRSKKSAASLLFHLETEVLALQRELLKRQIRRVVKDPGILWLCDLFIAHGAPGSKPGRGLPIGNLTSQHFANFYLAPLDHFIQEELRVRGYIRYMDDLLLFADSKVELRRHGLAIARFLRDRLDLSLKDEVTVLALVTEGIPFLGLRVFPGTIR